jgi:prevent-host-death family protein
MSDRIIEADPHWAEALSAVEHGESVTITRSGQPVAKLVPLPRVDRAEAQAAIERILAAREDLARRLDRPFTIDEIISLKNEGRR